MDKQNKEKKYFYALTDAQEYDATIRLTVPLYDLLHKTIVDVLRYHFGQGNSNMKPDKIKGLILDIGAGSGGESIGILKAFDNLKLVAVDMAAPMKFAFEENYATHIGGNAGDRVQYLTMDVLSAEFSKYYDLLNPELGELKRCVALSAYCIHHFPIVEKGKIYKIMYDFLDKGGILINLDLFSYSNQQISKYAHDFDIEYIKREFDNPSFIESRALSLPLRNRLKEKWIKHMEEDNVLDTVESQMEILKDLGFSNVECVARYFQQGLIIATK